LERGRERERKREREKRRMQNKIIKECRIKFCANFAHLVSLSHGNLRISNREMN
jgi:hypothetical protein